MVFQDAVTSFVDVDASLREQKDRRDQIIDDFKQIVIREATQLLQMGYLQPKKSLQLLSLRIMMLCCIGLLAFLHSTVYT